MSGIGAAVAALNIGAKLSGAKAVLAKVPPKVWYALAIAAALVAAFFWHQHTAHKALKAADATGYARARAEDQAALKKAHDQALASKLKTDQATAKITQIERQNNDRQAADIHARADALRVWRPASPIHSGQGDHSGVPAGARGSEPSSGAGSPAAVAVDWAWLVDTGERCDLNRAEVLSWRSWFDKQSKAWPR